MPELPEVETVRRTLLPLIKNKTIIDVEIYHEKMIKNVSTVEFKKQIVNKKILDILRFGKYLVFVLENTFLISHLRMEGKYYLRHNEVKGSHEHIMFYLDSGETLRYHDFRKFGTMDLFFDISLDEVLHKKPLSHLGYEPFDPKLTVSYLKDKFENSSRAIKTLLLDQSIIAGLGNIYVDEVLFITMINPLAKAKTLNESDLQLIIDASIDTMIKAINLGGTTIHSFSSDGISGKFQNELLVHTKCICPRCNEKILKIKVGGRGTYFCPNCQKERD